MQNVATLTVPEGADQVPRGYHYCCGLEGPEFAAVHRPGEPCWISDNLDPKAPEQVIFLALCRALGELGVGDGRLPAEHGPRIRRVFDEFLQLHVARGPR